MVEKDVIIKEKLKFSGLTDFDEAYKFARDWFLNNGFNLIENSYSEKVKGSNKDIEISWSAARALTDYFKVSLSIGWRVLGLSDVEVELDGRKKKMNKVMDLSLDMKGTLEKDYTNKWEGSAFNTFIKDLYNKYIIPHRTAQKEDNVQSMIQDFKEEMKAFLELTGRQ